MESPPEEENLGGLSTLLARSTPSAPTHPNRSGFVQSAERRFDVPEIAGSIPAARTYTIPRLRHLTDQDLRLRISGWWFDSTRSHRCFEVWFNLVRARGSGPRDWWFESTHLDDNGEQVTW